jgi:26S proteasome regulatory subunit N5
MQIFVEVARARSTLILSQMLEAKGKTAEAADTLGELAIETFGSMDRREKHEIIMEQMRLYKLRGDWARMGIVSKKINTKFFKDAKQHDLKLRFYELMISFSLNARKPLDVCKHYYEIYDTPMIKEDTTKTADALRNVVTFLVLSPFDNEQSDLMGRVEKLVDLDKVAEHKNLLKCFTTPELMRWPGIDALYNPILRSTATFDKSEEGNYRWEELHNRVVEHNIRVVSKYYTRITLKRLSELLDLSQDATETSLSGLVTNHTVHAKIDRPAGLVNFEKKKDNAEKLNLWSNDMTHLLSLVEATSHLVAREYAVSQAS